MEKPDPILDSKELELIEIFSKQYEDLQKPKLLTAIGSEIKRKTQSVMNE